MRIINTEKQKQDFEEMWTLTFLRLINDEYGFDYILNKNNNIKIPSEFPDIDAVAISQHQSLPILYLQLTQDKREDKEDKKQRDYVIFNMDLVFNSIKEKTEKYKKQNKNIKNVILLIQGCMHKDRALEIFNQAYVRKINKFDFKGIYYISPPKLFGSPKESKENYIEDWFFISLKDAFFKI